MIRFYTKYIRSNVINTKIFMCTSTNFKLASTGNNIETYCYKYNWMNLIYNKYYVFYLKKKYIIMISIRLSTYGNNNLAKFQYFLFL